MKMGLPTIKDDQHWTYGDYKTWPADERWELIDGVAYNMSPAPSANHQRLVGYLYRKIAEFLTGRPCEVVIAPFDILLPAEGETDDEVDTVVQPDLSVFCDPSKLTIAGARGAPDLVAKILSPWTSCKDQREKFDLYQRVGVREYWVVDPAGAWLTLYRLVGATRYDAGQIFEYRPDQAGPTIESVVLKGLAINLTDFFRDYRQAARAGHPSRDSIGWTGDPIGTHSPSPQKFANFRDASA